MALLTLPEFRVYVPALANVDSATLQSYIDAASDAVELYCNRKFSESDVEERVFSTPARVNHIYLKQTPIVYVEELLVVSIGAGCRRGTYFGDDATNAGEKILRCNADYLVNKLNGLVKVLPDPAISYGSGSYPTQYLVRYRGGYNPVPEAVKVATALFVKSLYTIGSSDSSLKSETIGDYSYERFAPTTSGSLTIGNSPAGAILQHYQRLGVNGL